MMVRDVMEEKGKVEMPILSDDQKMELQEKMFEAFNNQEEVSIIYFKGGRMHKIDGKIEKIDSNARKIVLNGGFIVFFSQICEIS